MKFKEVKTLEHLLKEYSAVGGGGHGQNAKANKNKSIASGPDSSNLSPTVNKTPQQDDKPKNVQPTTSQVKAKDLKDGDMVVDKDGKMSSVYSIVGQGNNPEALITKDDDGNLAEIPQNQTVDAIQKGDDLETIPDEEPKGMLSKYTDKFKAGQNFANKFIADGKLSKIAKRKGKKLKIKDLKGKIKKLSKARLKEADPKLFEINFNRRSVARDALDAPVRCGFEAETFWYGIEGTSNDYVDDMSISDVEYEYGDLPDSAYDYYNDWIREKAMDEYLPDLQDAWIEENRDEDEFIQDFMNSGNGPTEEGVEEYKEKFEEEDPIEYENREEDGWDEDNWARDLINEEYADEYQDFMQSVVEDEDQLLDDAIHECEGDYSMDDWVNDQYYSMSEFLDDFSFDYSRDSGDVEGVADAFNMWQKENSKFKTFPETGDYGDTSGSEDEWAIEKDSTIDPDEGAAAEIISPVFDSPREMLKELKSLLDWGEEEGAFGSNRSTGFHVTMSWQGPGRGGVDVSEPNKLKMALLLGDEYLLKQFDRLRNSFTKSQYQNVLRYAEGMKKGDYDSFKKLEKELEKGISREKYSSIHFKDNYKRDSKSDNELIEFRIAGNDYVDAYEKLVKAVVRYATVMKAGYDDNAYRKDYIAALSRVMRKSKEIDPERAKQYDNIDSPVIDAAKEIASKKDYFDILDILETSLNHYNEYLELTKPDADKKWKQSVKDYEKGTGEKLGIVEDDEEGITGYVEPDRLSPSKRAPAVLQKAQDRFARAVAMLARNISDGNERQTPKSKHIGAFRKYANDLQLDSEQLSKKLIQNINNANFDGTDRENIVKLQKGAIKLFSRKDVVDSPDYFDMQNFDPVAEGLWQFFQHDDAMDNTKLDKLQKLLVAVNPRLENQSVESSLKDLGRSRQKNEFYRKLQRGGYGESALIIPNMVSSNDAIKDLLKFLEPYKGYEHPTSKDHHVNIKSDDPYTTVVQMNLVQKLRHRLNYLRDLKLSDEEKYEKIKDQLLKLGNTFINELKPDDELFASLDNDNANQDGAMFLTVGDLERWNQYADRIAKLDDSEVYNFTSAYDDYVFGSINLDRYYRAKQDDGYDSIFANPGVKDLIKDRFKAYKKFLTNFDKIFQAEGFIDLKQDIAGKNVAHISNKDFEKNVRDKARATLNIPSHSYVYFNKDFYDTITDEDYEDRAAYLDNHLEHFNDDVNTGGKVFVIPAAHYGQAEDALSGLELIDSFESANNYYHTWRKKGYKEILKRFRQLYNIDYMDLDYMGNSNFLRASGDEYSKLQNLGIEITRKGDSRTGAPGQKDLVDRDELKNPLSGEPIDRGSAMMWSQSDDKEKEEKRFNAFDWGLYPPEMKPLVAKDLKGMKDREGYYSFKQSLDNVLKQIVDGDIDMALNYQDNVKGMVQAAGVEDYKNASSSEVADRTNWTNLTDYLKIERGVNDQGVELLKRVYDRYDSDHNWRPANPEAIGTERWAAAVKTAYEYIKSNYTVSAGNYFRKDADGNAGDDVSSIYSKEVTEQDYADMRSKYFDFNTIMMNGIQNYIVQPDVNRLVSFLKQPKNDETFKRAVLVSMQREREAGEEPNDFQGHLARARVYLQNRMRELNRNESIFAKFDKLTLEEQLLLIEDSEVLEKWSKKYKDSINCSNPKGFSQKAHCAGKKKKKIKENLSNVSEGPASDALPDNSIPYLLNKLLSEPMPAGDLRKQMDAYWALPVPQMLSDFRGVRAEGGNKADLRNVLKQYINSQLDPQIKKHVKLKEGKDEVIKKIEDLPDDDSQTDRIVQYIDSLLDDMGVGGRLKSIMSKLDDIDDKEVKRSQLKIAKLIASLEMTNLERMQLIAKWKKDQLVDTKKLLSGGKYDFSEVFRGYGNEDYITEFVDDLSNVIGQGIGAGEFLLATLSGKIEGIGSGKGKGDLLIDGNHVELKTKTAKDARFKDYHVQPDATWSGKVEGFKLDFADLEEVASMPATGLNSAMHISLLQNPKLTSDPARKKKALRSTAGIIQATNTGLDKKQINYLVKLMDAGDDAEFRQVYGKYNILNYLNIKRGQGDLEGILFMDKQTKTINYVRTEQEVLDLNLNVNTIYFVTSTNIYPYPQIGVRS